MGGTGDRMRIVGEVCLVLDNPEQEHTPECPWWGDQRAKVCTCGKFTCRVSKNMVTTAGLLHYAELWERGYTGGATPAPTVVFDQMSVATAVSPAISLTSEFDDLTIPASGTQPIDAGYPQNNDPDADNPGTTGPATLTWRSSLGVGEGTGTLSHIAIHETGAAGADPLLSVGAITGGSQVKAASQTAKVYVNHSLQNA